MRKVDRELWSEASTGKKVHILSENLVKVKWLGDDSSGKALA
jgi:hypothetical protein